MSAAGILACGAAVSCRRWTRSRASNISTSCGCGGFVSRCCAAPTPRQRSRLDPGRIGAMHVSADGSLMRAAAAGKTADLARDLDPAGGGGGPVRRLLDALVQHAPGAMPVAQCARSARRGARAACAAARNPVARRVRRWRRSICMYTPPRVATAVRASGRLRVPLARWQAAECRGLTTLVPHARCAFPTRMRAVC
jgi:hypothetical protein